jgi:hypothetical protein
VATSLQPRALEPARPEPRPVFAGRPLPLLLRGAAESIIFDARDPAGRPIELTMAECRRVEFPLGALWARERVTWLEDRLVMEPDRESELRAEILAVALEHKIASRFTAFVAIEERVSHTGERVTVVQPVELPQTWNQAFLTLPDMAGPPMAASRSVMMSVRPAQSRVGHALDSLRSAMTPADGDSAGPYAEEGQGTSFEDDSWAEPTSSASYEPPILDYQATSPEPVRQPSADPRREVETMLATTQDADGSFGGRVDRTAAALVALLCLGHTRRKGTRRRVVEKAARWLSQHKHEPLAQLALTILARVEGGGELPRRDEMKELLGAGAEGNALDRALEVSC